MSDDFVKNLLDNAHQVNRDELESMLDGVQGATIVATLDDREVADYTVLLNMEIELQSLQEFYLKRHMGRQMESVLNADDISSLSLQEVIQLGADHQFFDNVTEAHDFFKRVSAWEAQQAVFWNALRVRINNFTDFLEIRQKWRVVKIGSKYR